MADSHEQAIARLWAARLLGTNQEQPVAWIIGLRDDSRDSDDRRS